MLKNLRKATFLSSLTFSLVLLKSRAALAVATCTVNGREVPCEELGEQIKGFLGWGIGFILFLGLAQQIMI